MLVAAQARGHVVLSYVALRRGVGFVALGLPFALSVPWWLVTNRIESSISHYYYTGMRDLFIASLCAIAVLMVCCLGCDRRDRFAGMFSSLCSLGVAFFPARPYGSPTALQYDLGIVHYTFAALLFSTLAYFCLVLFKMTALNKQMTKQKRQRNVVYTICGYVIISSMLLIFLSRLFGVQHLAGNLAPTFVFESTALIAFGFAWITKGEFFLKDKEPPLVAETPEGRVGAA